MDSGSDVSLSDDEPMTASTVLSKLDEAWLNEKFSPELLPNQSDLVDCMLEQIQQMEENISKLKKGDFRITIHRMELERIRYIITSYLRVRLEKIETYGAHILGEETVRRPDERYLSAGEHKFAEDFLSSIENHFQILALRHMPSNFKNFNKEKCTISPNIDSFVFLRANQSVNGVFVEGDTRANDEEIDLEEGSQYIMPYGPIATQVTSGSVQLI